MRANAVVNESKTAPAKHAPPNHLAWFCYQLAIAFRAGTPVEEAFHLMAGGNMYFAKHIHQMADRVGTGLPLHLVLAEQNIFPYYLVEMVKVGEKSGTLDRIMEGLSGYYEQESAIRNEITEALKYPLALICLAGGVAMLLISRILPVFHEILQSVGGEMPGIAKALMNIGAFLSHNLMWLLGAFFSILLLVLAYRSSPPGRKRIARLKTETRLLGSLFLKTYTARVSAVLWYVLQSGLSASNALEMAAGVVDNEYVQAKITLCRQEIQRGLSLSACFDSIGIFPLEFVNMIRLGEKTGELPRVARKMALRYQEEVYAALERSISKIEPTLVAVLFAVISIILIGVMLPLINIMSSMG